jgi:hypothetical protein
MQIKGPKYAIFGTQHPQSNVAQQYYMKIILLVSLRSEEDRLKVTSNTFHLSSFIQISFRRVVKLMLSKYDQVTICYIYLPKHYQLQHLRSW